MLLRELQQKFAEQLIDKESSALSGIIGAQGLSGAEAISIYRSNFLENLSNGLKISFPVVVAILGEACFKYVAYDFALKTPSLSGDLNDYGSDFPAYLRGHPDTETLPYIAEVAALEWAIDLSSREGDTAYVDLAMFATYSADVLLQLKLPIHPACFILQFNWPAHAIWQAHQQENWSKPLQITQGDFFACVARADDTVRTMPLSYTEYVFLNHLAQGHPLGAALCTAQEVEPNFLPAPLIERAVALGVFANPHVHCSSQ